MCVWLCVMRVWDVLVFDVLPPGGACMGSALAFHALSFPFSLSARFACLLPVTCAVVCCCSFLHFQVESVCLSSDGKWALSGSVDGTVILWDLASGEVVKRLDDGTNEVF